MQGLISFTEEYACYFKSNSCELVPQEMIKLLFGKEVEIDHDVIKKKRDEFVANRGKKTINRTQTIENVQLLLLVSKQSNLGIGMELLLLQDLIETTFDISSVASCMKTDVWER